MDQDPKDKRGVIYSYQCGEIACDEEYIGGKVQGAPKGVLYHPCPQPTNNFNIIGREDQGLARTIKESIYIRVNTPTLNRNIGKFNLNHMLDRVYLNTAGLKMNSSNGHAHT